MKKREFLNALKSRLSKLPSKDVEERLNFYSEMIDDRIEEGRTEEEAVLEIGSVDEISAQITEDIPLIKIEKKKVKQKRRLKAWEILLLALGSPIWLSLAIAAFAVILSLYVVVWSVIVSIWAVFASFIACSVCGTAAGVLFTVCDNPLVGIATAGVGILCSGLAIFLFFGCKAATKGTVLLTKKIALGIKLFIKKETI